MRYIREDTVKLTRQYDKLKATIQQIGKWHFKHGHTDAAHLWTILYNYLEEIVNSKRTVRFIREPIFEITLNTSKKFFSIAAHKPTCTCFRGYYSKNSEYDKIISDLSEMLQKYGLCLLETEESIKRNGKSQKHFIEQIRQYEVKYVEEK